MARRIRLASLAVITFLVTLEMFLRVAEVGRSGVDKVYSDIYDVEYVMTPGATNPYSNDGETLNEQGLRGMDVAVQRTPGVYRVICLGDSTTYGFGLLEDSYPFILQKLLEQEFGDGGVEVVNGGVPGTGFLQQLLLFQRSLRQYKPDVVTLAGHPSMRMDIYNYRRRLESEYHRNLFTLRRHLARSQIYRTLRRFIKGPPVGYIPENETSPQAPEMRGLHMRDYRADLERFHEMAQEDGFDLVVFKPPYQLLVEELQAQGARPGMPEYDGRIHHRTVESMGGHFAERYGYAFVDVVPGFLCEPVDRDLFDDPNHPGGKGNRIIAEAVAPVIAERLKRIQP
ncbi:MAG: GDSL-type esterase/lipase family protein [Deltaproteobacteria bacterium]|nr:GDSL-type esterase/lipase family protein [Deltaproteobacteria bacterium]